MSKSIWTEEEICFLKDAYQEGLSLKDMAFFLKRSVTAINKAMFRFSVRVQGGRIKRKKGDQEETNFRYQKMVDIMDKYKKRNPPLPSFSAAIFLREELSENKVSPKIFKDDPHAIESVFKDFSGGNSSKELCYEKHLAQGLPSSAPCRKKKISYERFENFITFRDVLIWLEKKGFLIEIIQQDFFLWDSLQMLQPLYKVTVPGFINSSPHVFKTQTQIVVFANKIRVKESLPLFYVINVTAE